MAENTATPAEDLTPDQLIQRFSYRHLPELDHLIKVPGLPPLKPIERLGVLSRGNLDRLPLECVLEILETLDCQSLSRLSQTSLAIKGLVESFRPYFDLRMHASEALEALGRTRLLSQHSASSLHSVLVSKECAVCGKFGPGLFLPTCERFCLHCLYEHQCFRVTSFDGARELFGLSDDEINSLTAMFSIPGNYKVPYVSLKYEVSEIELVPMSQITRPVPGHDSTSRPVISRWSDPGNSAQ